MLGVFSCMVCDTDVKSGDALTSTSVPLFNFKDSQRVNGWDYVVRQCAPCLQNLGEPVKVLQRPHELDLAVFSNSDQPIVLKGSCPRD